MTRVSAVPITGDRDIDPQVIVEQFVHRNSTGQLVTDSHMIRLVANLTVVPIARLRETGQAVTRGTDFKVSRMSVGASVQLGESRPFGFPVLSSLFQRATVAAEKSPPKTRNSTSPRQAVKLARVASSGNIPT